jgi:hypothetical protein
MSNAWNPDRSGYGAPVGAGVGAGRGNAAATGPRNPAAADNLWMVSAGLTVIAAMLARGVVGRITAAQRQVMGAA